MSDSHHLFIELKKKFPTDVWPWLVVSLREDPLVWEQLTTTDIGLRALVTFPARAEFWSPTGLAVLNLGCPESLDESGKLPQRSVNKALLKRANQAYDAWRPGSDAPVTLPAAGLIALALREMRLTVADWAAVFDGLADGWWLKRTVFACLYGMAPDPIELLRALLSSKVNHNEIVGQSTTLAHSRIPLTLHALLSNPLDQERQLEILQSLIEDLPIGLSLNILNRLSMRRPWLGVKLAETLIESKDGKASFQAVSFPNRVSEDALDDWRQGSQLTHILGLMRLAEAKHYAAHSQETVSLLSDVIEQNGRLQGHLYALLARATEDGGKNGRTEKKRRLAAWEQAAQWVPGDSRYQAGKALALLDLGLTAEAQLHLNDLIAREGYENSAILELAAALVAKEAGDQEAAVQFAVRVLALIEAETDPVIDQDTLYKLILLFLEFGRLPDAVGVALASLGWYPSNIEMLSLLAKTQLRLGIPDEALTSAFVGLGIEAAGINAGVETSKKVDFHRLYVEGLEACGAWEAALEERTTLLQETEEPELADWRSLAACALNAGRPGQAVLACQRSLAIEPEDDVSFELMGEATLMMGDLASAQEYYQQAVRLAPHREALWLNLARIYSMQGDENQALVTLRAGSQAVSGAPRIYLALGEAYSAQKSPTQALTNLRRAAGLVSIANKVKDQTPIRGASGTGPLTEPVGGSVDYALTMQVAQRLGGTLHTLGHLDEAFQVLKEAYETEVEDPSNDLDLRAELAFTYAQVLMSLNDWPAAVPLLEVVVSFQPARQAARLGLAEALTQSANAATIKERVIPALQSLSQGEPEAVEEAEGTDHRSSTGVQAQAKALLAEALVKAGESQPALDAYREALDTDLVNDVEWRLRLSLGLSRAAMSMGQPEMAVTVLTETAKKDPQNAEVLQVLSEAYLANGLFDEAWQIAREARDVQPLNIEGLIWFVGQGLLLLEQEDKNQTESRQEVGQVLDQVRELNPQRGDLLIRLGCLLQVYGDRTGAIEVLRELGAADDTKDVTISDLIEASRELRSLGDTQGAISLLQRAVSQYSAAVDSSGAAGESAVEAVLGASSGAPTRRSDLQKEIDEVDVLLELVAAYRQADDTHAALRVLEQANSLAPNNVDLLQEQASLLNEIGREEAALDCLEAALEHSPGDVYLHYQMATVFRRLGNLSDALSHAGLAIDHVGEEPDMDFNWQARWLAATLALALLRPNQALAYLTGGASTNGDKSRDGTSRDGTSRYDTSFGLFIGVEPTPFEYKAACLGAELALNAGDIGAAQKAVRWLTAVAPDEPNTIALQAYLSGLMGDYELGRKQFKLVMDASPDILNEEGQELSETLPGKERVSLSVLAYAAQGIALWEPALELSRRDVERTPNEPLAHLRLAQVLVRRAEAQRLCKALNVVQRAPGDNAFSENAHAAFDAAMLAAERIVGYKEDGAQVSAQDEPFNILKRWRIRGRSAFEPNPKNANDQLGEVDSNLMRPDELAALVAALGSNQKWLGVVKAIQADWQKGSNSNPGLKHPLVLTQLALVLGEDSPQRALDLARQALASLGSESGAYYLAKPMLVYLVARLSLQAEDYAAAHEAIQEALDAWPDEPRWQNLAAEIYRVNARTADPEALRQAIKHLEEAALLEPNYAGHHLALGQAYIQAGSLDLGIQALEQACQVGTDEPEPWLALAQVLIRTGDLDRAASSAEKAVEISDDPIGALLLRGEIAIQAGSPRGALSRAQTILRSHPDCAPAMKLLALSLEALDRPADALKALEKTIPQYEDDYELQIERARLISRVRGLDAALSVLQELTTRFPTRSAPLALRAEWLSDAGQFEEAVQAARRALQIGEDDLAPQTLGRLHYLIGAHMLRAGQLDQAVYHLSESTRNDPDFIDAYLELGNVHQMRRQDKQALKVYQSAIEAAPDDYRPYYQAGLTLKESKDYVGAEDMLRRAAHLAPDEVSVHRLLGAVVALNLVHNRRMVTSEG